MYIDAYNIPASAIPSGNWYYTINAPFYWAAPHNEALLESIDVIELVLGVGGPQITTFNDLMGIKWVKGFVPQQLGVLVGTENLTGASPLYPSMNLGDIFPALPNIDVEFLEPCFEGNLDGVNPALAINNFHTNHYTIEKIIRGSEQLNNVILWNDAGDEINVYIRYHVLEGDLKPEYSGVFDS